MFPMSLGNAIGVPQGSRQMLGGYTISDSNLWDDHVLRRRRDGSEEGGAIERPPGYAGGHGVLVMWERFGRSGP